MLRVLGLVVSIGLADGVNPTSIGPSLYLASERHPVRNVLKFAAGYFVVLLIGGLVLTLGPGRAILALVPKPSLTARYVLETLAGVAMLLTSAILWRRRETFASRDPDAGSHRRRRAPMLMGATISAVELPTALPYFAAIAAIVGSGLRFLDQVILVVIYDLCFVLPLLGIVATVVIAGEQAVLLLARARKFMHRHWPVLVSALALVAGAFVTTLGVTGLAIGVHGPVGRISRRVRHVITR